jgi:hypothetical protein
VIFTLKNQLGYKESRSQNYLAKLEVVSRPRIRVLTKDKQLSFCTPAKYIRGAHYFAGVQGLEPRYSGPKPDVLPLDDTPIFLLFVIRAL